MKMGYYESFLLPIFKLTPTASSLLSVKSLPSLKMRNSIISTRKKMKLPHKCVMQDPKSLPTTQCHADP